MIPNYLLDLEFREILGLLGAFIYAGSYTLVAFDRITSQTPTYYSCKFVAACLVLSSLQYSFNLAAALIQIFFVFVSIIGITRHYNRRATVRRNETATTRLDWKVSAAID